MKRIFVWAVGMCAVCGTVSAQLTLEECYRAARENYPLVRQFDLIERTKDFTVENAAKGYFPQLSFSGKASYQSDVTKMPFSIPGVEFGLDNDQYQLVLELNQTVWDGGVVRNRKEEARVKSEVQKGQLEPLCVERPGEPIILRHVAHRRPVGTECLVASPVGTQPWPGECVHAARGGQSGRFGCRSGGTVECSADRE